MRFLKITIGILIVFVGSFFLQLTIFDEFVKTLTYNIIGVLFLFSGLWYINKNIYQRRSTNTKKFRKVSTVNRNRKKR